MLVKGLRKPNLAHSLFVCGLELSKNVFITVLKIWRKEKEEEYPTGTDVMWSAKLKTSTLQPFQKKFSYSWVRKGQVNCRCSNNRGPSQSYRELRNWDKGVELS